MIIFSLFGFDWYKSAGVVRFALIELLVSSVSRSSSLLLQDRKFRPFAYIY